MSEIRALERRPSHPDLVSDLLSAWRAMAYRTRRELDDADRRGAGCGWPGCCPQQAHLRIQLDDVLRALTPRSRRQLRIVLTPLDARVQQQHLPDPGPPPHLPTWQ